MIAASTANGQMHPLRVYNARGAGAPIEVDLGDQPGVVSLWRCTGRGPEAAVPAATGVLDLDEAFESLRAETEERVFHVRLESGGTMIGPALIVEPLAPLGDATDAWTARVLRGFESGDRTTIESLLRVPPKAREAVRRMIEADEAVRDPAPALRIYEERWIVLKTSAGDVTIALRPDAAPRTAFHFRSLFEGGFFTGTPVRPLADAASDLVPLLAAGDPSGEGVSGCGWTLPFERSTLTCGAGVVAAARVSGRPNSASSQFVVVLRDEMGAALDGSVTPFGVIVGGAEAVASLAEGRGGSITGCVLIPAPADSAPARPIPLEPGRPARGER